MITERLDRGWLIRCGDDPSPLLIHGAELRIGSATGNQLVLDDLEVAPRHCTLRREGRGIRLYDHGSTSGTICDGSRLLEPRTVTERTRLILGSECLTIRPLPPLPNAAPLRRGFLPHTGASKVDDPDPPAEAPRSRFRRPGAALSPLFVLILSLSLSALTSAGVIAYAFASPSPASKSSSPRLSSEDPPTLHPAPQEEATSPARSPTTPTPEPPQGQRPRLRSAPAIRVTEGATWASIAHDHDLAVDALQAANTNLRRPLRPGDQLVLPASDAISTEPPQHSPSPSCGVSLAIPGDTHSIGSVNFGTLDNALRLPKLDLYTLRCPRHAFATATTARALIDAIACFRATSGYTGEIVVGDISQERGGAFGPHRSHQSGRDVDLWLPTAGGRYGRGCNHCGTDLCRPEPATVDWAATAALIDTLAARPEVEVIFLDFDLQAPLRQAALAAGTPPAALDARVQWPRRGAPSLVQHSPGHVHHLHIRFRCADGDPECVARPQAATTRELIHP